MLYGHRRMTMVLARFDEAEWSIQLNRLHAKRKAAFAATCAERMFPVYARFCVLMQGGQPEVLREILTRLWDDIEGMPMSGHEINSRLKIVMEAIPQKDEGGFILEQAAAEDAGAALAYALRCRRTGSAVEAVWAARRAYEAIDYNVINLEFISTNADRSEEQILAHPLIQQELLRQKRDIDELIQQKITVKHLRERSSQEAASFLSSAH